MPRVDGNKQDHQRLRQERNRRYQSKLEVKARKREKDRVYQQRKREQVRLERHEDPLARLADVVTQREYLGEENDVIIEAEIRESLEEAEETIEVSGMVEEDGEVLENSAASV